MPSQELAKSLESFGQQHLLAFWDSLPAERQAELESQLESIDLELIAALFKGDVDQPDWAAEARRATPPPAMRLADRRGEGTSSLGLDPVDAKKAGAAAMAAGKLGILLVAGGQGSRLGFEHPKGMYPIGPVSGATLLEIHLRKAVGLAKKYGKSVPVYLMTSPVTHAETIAFLADHNRFGMPEEDVFVFCQGTMPAVDEKTGKLLLADKHQLFLSPDGHGGTVAALEKSGAIANMKARGIEQLFYFQVDNPIVPMCDAELIGYHLLSKSELTSIAVAKQTPQEKLGNFVMLGDRLHVIEYSDFPEDVAQELNDDGSLKFWAGSIAIHVFDVAFLERMLSFKDALPFHVAHKKVPHLNAEGKLVEPTEPNALKFERFIFDLLPQAERPIVVEYTEQECFAPLKNAPGAPKDTPEYVQQFMVDQHREWLEAAGAKVDGDVAVEIDPVWAVDADEVAKRVDADTTFTEATYLRD
ncbi:UTP--glucose-1-phosphate uridylyltransferase [Aeoliella sp. ICT_H6.2]|uniref:UTP--glucose-1-phosphate uridylyltransferase n=1 Tax=Aeoliella straminimaris TaxID=2954799 RepID=A0A9X2FDU5_9BACT|nr:UTP--glucose-1-phosphate uridylyltransferase [Aeoliella straminimaris]MCO6046809.1 UTP--glucose-1-phosphate uridylyltransferase [Aeoliella straminimaris]